MEWPRRWLRRIRLLLRRDAVEAAMDEELRYHVECETAERIRGGMAPDAARREALRDFGGIERFKEEARDARGVRPVEDLIADTRYAARVLGRNPGFTAAAILTLALGIGAASAIFSVVYGVLLRPLPYADPDRLVVLWERNVARNKDRNVVAVGNFEAWRDRTRAFAGMAALVPRPVTLADAAVPERVAGAEVSPGYFRLLGVAPALGREFVPAEGEPGGADAVMLSDAFWKRRFAADPHVVGRTLIASGTAHTIVGVMPAGFDPPAFGWLGAQELWFPFVASPQTRSWGRFLLVIARLKPDVPLDFAQSDMTAAGDRLAREVDSDRGWTATVMPLVQQITGDVRTALLILLAAVGLLLLIATANVATLMLSLVRRRGRELAIRRALGATDDRLFRQVFSQSLLLGLLGSAAGLLTMRPAVSLLVWLLPPDAPRLTAIQVDGRVLAITSAVAILAAIVSGTIAAVRGRRSAGLPLFSPGAGDGRVAARAGGLALVTAEMAIALALGVMAMLMARSFAGLRAVDVGFSAERVLAARVALTSDRYRDAGSQRLFFETLVARVRGLPGVESAGVISMRPFGGLSTATEVRDARPGRTPGAEAAIVADIRFADAGAFRTLRIPVLRGGLFPTTDSTAPPRVVISDSLARSVWPGQDAVGQQLHLALYGEIDAEVVGVVGDLHLMDPRTPVKPVAYLSAARFPSDTRDLIVRVGGDPQAIVPSLRTLLASIDPDVPLYQAISLPGLIDASLASDRFTTVLLSAFAALALLLGGVGVFGVFSGEVASRRKEIAIRMALGAGTLAIVTMVLRQALVRASLGVAGGAVLALWLARSMRSLLFGVESTDPASFVATAAIVCGLALLATLIPTMQVLRSAPLGSLRTD
jgi:putative ABC transport system permease protein